MPQFWFGLLISDRAQIQHPTWPKPPKSTRAHKKLHFLSIPTVHSLSTAWAVSSSFSPFPVVPKSPSSSLHFQPLRDAVLNNIIENLENSIIFQIPTDQDSETSEIIIHESRRSIFILEPPWISTLFLKGLYKKTNQDLNRECKETEKTKYNIFRRRQIKEDTGAWERMVEEYRQLEREMCERKLAPNLPHVKGLFLGWLEPLRDAIDRAEVAAVKETEGSFCTPH